MGARSLLALPALLVLSCSNAPSKLDPTTAPIPDKGDKGDKGDKADRPNGDGNDPWAAKPDRSPSHDRDDDSPLGGINVMATLKKVMESVQKPGPYEPPEKSPDFDPDKPYWGVLELSGGMVEKRGFSLFGGGRGTELRTLVDRLRDLAKDTRISGLLLRIDGLSGSLPDVVELRAAMHDVRAAKKPIVCHVEDASNATYLVLAACDRIGIAPLGDVAITGPAAMPIHVKPLLDKLGVTADFLHVGAYKGAAEPLTRDAPSKEMEETLGAILDRHYATLVDTIAADRKLAPDAVKGLVDTGLFTSDKAKEAKLVDDVASFEDFRASAVQGPWKRIKLSEEVGGLDTVMAIGRFTGALPPKKPFGPHVALVYAIGNIVDGDGRGVLGAREEIASQTLVAALRAIAADPDVKAVVLRIDSGGGSAQASELIWRAVGELKAKKPVIVSMSDVAASGGYYIASGATKIYALPDTLTGSIGVVGGKLALAGALKQLGVNTFPMGRGKRATMMTSFSAWTDDEKRAIQAQMESVYDVFVGRVAAGRKKSVDDVKKIAEGRVWTGEKAKELGLVDELGGLDAALAEANKLAGTEPGDLEIYPPTPTLRDIVHGFGGVQAPLGLSTQLEAIGKVDPRVASAARSLLGIVESFRDTQIQTITVLPEIR